MKNLMLGPSKLLFSLSLAVALAQGSAPGMALPTHSGEESLLSDSGEQHAPDKEAQPSKQVQVRTLNARNQKPSRTSDAPAAGEGRKITVMASAYCLRGLTARGTGVEYGTIAVDPRVIPLGSKIYVPGYGWGRALDTGGAIRGNVIDIWLPTSGQCFSWGVRPVTITVFDR